MWPRGFDCAVMLLAVTQIERVDEELRHGPSDQVQCMNGRMLPVAVPGRNE